MKHRLFIAASLVCSLIFNSCSGSSPDKFIGRWRSLDPTTPGIVTIKKNGAFFESIPDNNPDQKPIVFAYDQERDVLIAENEGMEIVYISKTKHLKFNPQESSIGGSVEMEKVK